MKLAILALLAAYAVGEADPLFTELALPAGRDPEALAAADTNCYGWPYPIVTNGETETVTVLFGDGAGGLRETAGSPFALTGCAQLTQLATGDLSGGRIRDIAVTCVYSG